ncbi:mechanosensitive ion channel, partial [Desulfobulbus sp. US4]|nr:mechanosensitive ion channel [Desulfobulbus sp. US4]
NSVQTELLATYISKILQYENVLLIGEKGDMGAKSTTYSLKKALEELNFKENTNYFYKSFDSKQEEGKVEQQLDGIINEIWEGWGEELDSTAVLIAASASYGADIASSLRYGKNRFTIIGADSFSTKDFLDHLKSKPVEAIEPGYYSDGIYTVSPLKIEASGRVAQEGAERYKKKYEKDPSLIAIGYYDAARIGIEAIKQAGKSAGGQGDIKNYREAIRKELQKSIYNSKVSDARFTTISQYKEQRLEPVRKQLQLLQETRNRKELNTAVNKGEVFVIGEQHYAATNLVYTGMKINSINNVDVKAGVFTMDFYLWFRYGKDFAFKPSEIEFSNAVKPIRFKTKAGPDATPLKMQEGILVDDERTEENIFSRLYRIKGKFKIDFNPEFRRFGRYVLGTSFHHKGLKRKDLVYILDTLMKPVKNGQEMEQAEYLKAQEVLNTDSGWTIADTLFFQDSVKKKIIEHIRYIKEDQLESYSRFNAVIRIKNYEWTLRGIIAKISEWTNPSANTALYLAIICFSIWIFLLYLEKKGQVKFFKLHWLLQSICAITALLALQISLMQRFEKRDFLDRQNQELIMLLFDMLWWLVPATLVNSALEDFIWRPIEIQTRRRITYTARAATGFLVYFMACSGIVAFVLDETLTGLLAASGVFTGFIVIVKFVDFTNILAGITISIERSFRIGDWIGIGGHEGKVTDITWGTTRILTKNGTILSVPNTQAVTSLVENYSYPDERCRLRVTVEIKSVNGPEKTRKLLLQAVLSVKEVLSHPPPFIEFKGSGQGEELSTQFTIWFQVKDYAKKHEYLNAVRESVWTHLNANAYEIISKNSLEGQEVDLESLSE